MCVQLCAYFTLVIILYGKIRMVNVEFSVQPINNIVDDKNSITSA